MPPVGSSLRESQRISDPASLAGCDDALNHLLRLTSRMVGVPAVLVLELDGNELRTRGQLGGPHVAAVERLCREVVVRGAPLLVENLRTDLRFRSEAVADSGDAAGFAAVPLPATRAGGRGVLAVLDRAPREWSEAEVQSLAELAAALAHQLDRESLERANRALAAEVERSEARYRRVAEASGGLVFALDQWGRVEEINAAGAELLGEPVDELLGRDFLELVAPEDRRVAADLLCHRVQDDQGRAQAEVHVLGATGERRLLRVTSAPVLEDGVVRGTFGVARDVTDERARELQYRRVERMASVAPLLGGVCHELNNPLTSIKSFAELLLMDPRSADDREALEIVQREAHRAAKIVSDLRMVARQSQEVGVNRTQVDLNRVVERVVASRQETLAASRVQLRLDLAEALPPAWAVPPHLEQVVLQLVLNAEQALLGGDEPRELTVRTFRLAKGVGVEVQDNGPGIQPDHLERIFDPFWTTKNAGEGTGLGLSLVHSIVADHGGLIRVDSSPGHGARFTVDLPCLDARGVGPDAVEVDRSARRTLRLLVVDDEAPIRHSLGSYMRRRGHHVDEATEGGAALRVVDQSPADAPYDVIIADLRMPGLDGEQLFARLRERGGGLEKRLVFITGDADSPDVADVLNSAGVPVVQKPFELAEIAQIIETQAGMTES